MGLGLNIPTEEPKGLGLTIPSAQPAEPEVKEPRTLREELSSRTQDLLGQTELGLVRGGGKVINALEGIPQPKDVVSDPGRLIDYAREPWNYFLDKIEGAGNILLETAGVPDPDMSLDPLKIEKEFGAYPERQTAMYQKRKADREQRNEYIRNEIKKYEEEYGASPTVSTFLSYAPELLVAMGGGILDAPSTAAVTDSLLMRGEALQEGEDPSKAAFHGALGGYLGTKFFNTLFNRLTPDELRVLNSRAQSKEGIDDTLTLLEYLQKNPNISYDLATQAKTGNPVVDRIIEQQRRNMSDIAFKEYMDTLGTVSKKGRQSVEELTTNFKQNIDDLYQKMKNEANQAWDTVAKLQDNTQTIPSEIVAGNIDDILNKYGPENRPVKTFVNRMFKGQADELQLQEIDKAIASAKADIEAARGVLPEPEFKALKKANEQEIRDLLGQKMLYKGMAAEDASQLTPERIVDMIKSLNDKQYLSGGNINTKNKVQMRMIGDVRNVLMEQLDQFDNIDEFKKAYDTARAKSRGLYETFGYEGGKNMGKKVTSYELGQMLDAVPSDQAGVVREMLNYNPEQFVRKLNEFEGRIPQSTLNSFKKAYLEKRLRPAPTGTLKEPGRLTEQFETDISQILDTADGRAMVKELYGEPTLDRLVVVRELNKALQSAAKEGTLPKQSLVSWIRDLPNTVSTVFGQRIKDMLYLDRQLDAYKQLVKGGYDANDIANQIMKGNLDSPKSNFLNKIFRR